jgi:hypothetical protein
VEEMVCVRVWRVVLLSHFDFARRVLVRVEVRVLLEQPSMLLLVLLVLLVLVLVVAVAVVAAAPSVVVQSDRALAVVSHLLPLEVEEVVV